MDFLAVLNIEKENMGASGRNNLWLPCHGKPIISYNPATAKEIARVISCNAIQYEEIVSNAQRAFHQWQQVPAPTRGELVRILGEKLRQHKKSLGSLVANESGKSKREGEGEVQEMIDMADFAVGQSRMLYGLTMHSERRQHRLYEQWHPYGITGVITSFNFPVAVWAWNAFIAVICGNTVIWKPSSKTPLCAIAVQKICNEVMKDFGVEGIFSLVIPESHELTEQFISDIRVPLLSFTGSCIVGAKVNELVAKKMGRVILELGGNNAVIVDESADLSLAIPAIVFGAVGTAGQRCTSTRRLFVHTSLFEDVCSRLVKAYKQITIGDPLEDKNLMGPLIDKSAVESFIKAINEIKAQKGEILFGGKALEREGFYVQPTLVKANHDWPIVLQETFAPILYVMPYNKLADAISMQNATEQGLSSALFTNSLLASEFFLSAIGSDCGIANINVGTSGAEIGGAFGGEKRTGGGREAGSDAWKAYMRRQTNTINWGNTLPLAQGIKFEITS